MAFTIRLPLFVIIASMGFVFSANCLANDVSKRGNSLTYIQNEFQTNLDIYRTDGSNAECFNVIRARQHATDAIELGDTSLARKFNAFNASLSGKCRLASFKIPGVSGVASESSAKQNEWERCAAFSELIAMADRGRIVSSCDNTHMFIQRD